MIGHLFKLLGTIVFLLGLAWSAIIFASPIPAATTAAASTGLMIGRAVAIAPGLGIALSGLLLFAIGEALWLLARIARSAASTMHSAADIADALERPSVRTDAAANFNDAVKIFQAQTGKAEPGLAIRELATDALRQKGFLR